MISGIVLGFLLAGYVVIAYTLPATEPPQNNTPSPINIGSTDQTKQGNLEIGDWLFVDGGIKIGSYQNSARPTCDSTDKGTLIFDTTESKPYMCNGSDWNEYTGSKGDSGVVGSIGNTGPQGSQGIQGSQGPIGPQGSTNFTRPPSGRYGICYERHGSAPGKRCVSASSPAFCESSRARNIVSLCACQNGFSRVVTGVDWEPTFRYADHWFSCVKS